MTGTPLSVTHNTCTLSQQVVHYHSWYSTICNTQHMYTATTNIPSCETQYMYTVATDIPLSVIQLHYHSRPATMCHTQYMYTLTTGTPLPVLRMYTITCSLYVHYNNRYSAVCNTQYMHTITTNIPLSVTYNTCPQSQRALLQHF